MIDANALAELRGGLTVAFGDALRPLANTQDALVRALNRPPMQPVTHRVIQQVAFAGAVSWINLGGPTQGFYWHVRQVYVGGATRPTAAAGSADLFVSAAPLSQLTDLAQAAVIDHRDFTATLPNVAFYGAGDLKLVPRERLWLAITGGTVGQSYFAAASIDEHQDAAYPQQVHA